MWYHSQMKRAYNKEGGMLGEQELNPGHLAVKQRLRPPQGPIISITDNSGD